MKYLVDIPNNYKNPGNLTFFLHLNYNLKIHCLKLKDKNLPIAEHHMFHHSVSNALKENMVFYYKEYYLLNKIIMINKYRLNKPAIVILPF